MTTSLPYQSGSGNEPILSYKITFFYIIFLTTDILNDKRNFALCQIVKLDYLYYNIKKETELKTMCSILLSINPQYVESILNGTKEYEFRKTVCKKHIDKIIIYSTSPIMKVVGEAEVDDILIGDPEMIWQLTKKKSGIDKIFFDEYYKNKTEAVAYKLKNVIKFDSPKTLNDYVYIMHHSLTSI